VPLLTAAERGLIYSTVVPVAANVFTDERHRAVAVVAARAVRGWRDLNGARIAVNARDSITAAALVGRLRLEGVRDYVFVEIPFANMGLAVAGGNVAAAGMNEPFLTQSLARGDGVLLDWVMGGGMPFASAEVSAIVVSADLLRRDPPAAKAYLRAHLQAVRWINANTGQARRVIARRLDLTRDVAERFNLLRWPEDARNDPALLDAMQPLLIEIGALKTAIPARRLYDETLLDQVLAERQAGR
jgi:NitT/TauT family transport system substrate-binding protein